MSVYGYKVVVAEVDQCACHTFAPGMNKIAKVGAVEWHIEGVVIKNMLCQKKQGACNASMNLFLRLIDAAVKIFEFILTQGVDDFVAKTPVEQDEASESVGRNKADVGGFERCD